MADGALDDGIDVGLNDGADVVDLNDVGTLVDGLADVGLDVGTWVGLDVGLSVGIDVGLNVGMRVDGLAVGFSDIVGLNVGCAVGLGVGHPLVYRGGPNWHFPLEHVSSPATKSDDEDQQSKEPY